MSSNFAREIQAGRDPAFHRLKIHFAQARPRRTSRTLLCSAICRLLAVQFGRRSDAAHWLRARKRSPARFGLNAGRQRRAVPTRRAGRGAIGDCEPVGSDSIREAIAADRELRLRSDREAS